MLMDSRKNSNKKTVLLGGCLLLPFEIGAGATIKTFDDQYVCTAPVQTILQDNSIFTKFETPDSVYYVFKRLAQVCEVQATMPLAA